MLQRRLTIIFVDISNKHAQSVHLPQGVLANDWEMNRNDMWKIRVFPSPRSTDGNARVVAEDPTATTFRATERLPPQ